MTGKTLIYNQIRQGQQASTNQYPKYHLLSDVYKVVLKNHAQLSMNDHFSPQQIFQFVKNL